jgi:hypothetical protein
MSGNGFCRLGALAHRSGSHEHSMHAIKFFKCQDGQTTLDVKTVHVRSFMGMRICSGHVFHGCTCVVLDPPLQNLATTMPLTRVPDLQAMHKRSPLHARNLHLIFMMIGNAAFALSLWAVDCGSPPLSICRALAVHTLPGSTCKRELQPASTLSALNSTIIH